MTVEQRLARLERGNRNWRWLACVLLAALGVVLLAGQAKNNDLLDLEVRSLSVVDDDGVNRISLDTKDGLASLRVCGQKKDSLVWLFVSDDGSSNLKFHGGDGMGSMTLSNGSGGSPSLEMSTSDPRIGARLVTGPEGSYLHLDTQGWGQGVELAAEADGTSRLELKAKHVLGRASMWVTPEGEAELTLGDRERKSRVRLGVSEDQVPRLILSDAGENERAVLGVTETEDRITGPRATTAERATLTLYDARGDVIWQAPR